MNIIFRVFTNLEDALAERPQIAFVCNPSSLHIPVAVACARAGCDLFLEKPVSDSLGRHFRPHARGQKRRPHRSWWDINFVFTPASAL
jgi:hypothetical protein